MIRHPPRPKRNYPLFPYTTLFRSDLHESRCANMRTGLADKSAFLAYQTINPCLVKLVVTHIAQHGVTVRRGITQGKIVHIAGFFRGIDSEVVPLLTE